jgi:hypothetical protein
MRLSEKRLKEIKDYWARQGGDICALLSHIDAQEGDLAEAWAYIERMQDGEVRLEAQRNALKDENARLQARCDRLQAFRANLQRASATHRLEILRLRAALEDLAKTGCRHDLNPTLVDGHEPGWGWHSYLVGMDSSVRDRARAALRGED